MVSQILAHGGTKAPIVDDDDLDAGIGRAGPDTVDGAAEASPRTREDDDAHGRRIQWQGPFDPVEAAPTNGCGSGRDADAIEMLLYDASGCLHHIGLRGE